MDTVLIIETDTETIAILSDLLSASGYMPDAVDDIEAARQKVAGNPPRLVVIGPQLGKSTGFLACSLIKKTPQARGIPCVLLYTDREEGQVQRHQSLAGRAEVYLRKPFGVDEFRAAVAAYLPLGETAPPAVIEEDMVIEEEVAEVAPPPAVVEEVFEEVIEEVIEAPAPPPEGGAEFDRLRLDVTRLQAELAQARQEADAAHEESKRARQEAKAAKDVPPEALAEAEALRTEVSRLEKQLELAQKQAEETAEAAEKSKKGKGGSDTRQILELKQSLNKRESEIVDLKTATLQKDKQLLDLREKINDGEMKHLELEEAGQQRDRELASLRGQIEALTADKDVAAKRTEDLGRRLKSAEEGLKKAKEEAEAQRTAHDAALRDRDEAHARTLERAGEELTAAKDAERQGALDALRAELTAEKDAALAALRAEHEAATKVQQDRHDTEIYEMQERFRRSMNQQEEKLNAEKAKALTEVQERHDGQVGELVTAQEAEVGGLKTRIEALEARIEEANRVAEEHVATIGKITEDRDETARQRETLDGELKTSQVAAEHLRIEQEKDRARIAGLEKDLADTQGVRDSLRGKLQGDLERVDKSKQAIAVALELLNEVEPL